MNVLVSIDESKLDAMMTLGIINKDTQVYYPGEYEEDNKEKISPAISVITEQLYSKSKEENDTMKAIREASENSQADDYYTGNDYFIAYNTNTGRLNILSADDIDNGYDALGNYPFSSKESAQKIVDKLGEQKIINDCNLF